MKKNRRNVVVTTSLLSALTLTSVLLLAISPAPLKRDGAESLLAVDGASSESLARVFDTHTRFEARRWKYIYIHHSASQYTDGATLVRQDNLLGDHFVVGNGAGMQDGEIEIGQRWESQSAANPIGAETDGDCITICIAGDIDSAPPTSTQVVRLRQLVSALQAKCNIPAANVILRTAADSPTGIGAKFPATGFLASILR